MIIITGIRPTACLNSECACMYVCVQYVAEERGEPSEAEALAAVWSAGERRAEVIVSDGRW